MNMATTPSPSPQGSREPALNPNLQQARARDYSEAQNGSDPMASVSIKKNGPAVWPFVWAVVTIGLVVMTIWIFIG
jgi:hypothetical protein